VLGCSLGLVVLEASSYTVRLVHYTLQNYLSNNTDLFDSPHSTMAESCLTYLNFQSIWDLSPSFPWSGPATPFFEYASYYRGIHASREVTASVKTLALRLLGRFDKHVSSGILLSLSRDNLDRERGKSNRAGFTGLHGATYLGNVEIAVSLLGMKKWDLGSTDVEGNTAISWAARKGHGAMVKILLDQEDASPNHADKDGRTPLSWAARNGHWGIVETFLKRGILLQTPRIETAGHLSR